METSGQLEVDGARLAWRRVEGEGPTVVWLGGFRSDMTGTKAQALADWATEKGRGFLRFDYFAHGASSGDFLEGTIGRWRNDALAVIDELTEGPLILVGSSMGGWIALLAAIARLSRVRGMVLIAPAPDFTGRLIEPSLSDEAKAALEEQGVWMQPSPYGDPYPITRRLLKDGKLWSVLGTALHIPAPIRILHGDQDEEVPWMHGFEVARTVAPDQPGGAADFKLIPGGDHRLSTPENLAAIIEAVEIVSA